MTDILPRDILLYAGGDAWRRFGTFTRRTTRLARNGEGQQETFARADGATCAHYLGYDGLLHLAAAGIIRPHWIDTNGDGIPDTLSYLGESSCVNSLLQSQALATTWSATADTPTNNTADTLAPDGTQTATKLVPTSANSLHYQSQAVTITANEFVAASIYVKAGASYNGFVLVVSDGAVTNGIKVGINLSTGAVVLAGAAFGTGTFGGATVVAYPGGWYRILLWGAIGNAVTSATVFTEVFDTAAHASTQSVYVGDTVNGIYAWGAQLERNGTAAAGNIPPKEYVATAAGAVTKAADSCIVPVPQDTVAQSVYVRFQERGCIAMSPNGRIFEISKFGSNPRFFIYATSGKYSMAVVSAGGVQWSPIAAVAPNYGDLVELVGSYDGASAVSLTQALNGGAGATTVAAAGAPGAALWGLASAGLLCAGDGSSPTPGALIRAVLAQGVHTLAEFQAVP